ncbi:hypothetical protein Bbelb_126560 [Branchiostoma belcheri]|nr:hypothetical protein Bbelb_126560 [Branchiostoma belcheri]
MAKAAILLKPRYLQRHLSPGRIDAAVRNSIFGMHFGDLERARSAELLQTARRSRGTPRTLGISEKLDKRSLTTAVNLLGDRRLQWVGRGRPRWDLCPAVKTPESFDVAQSIPSGWNTN